MSTDGRSGDIFCDDNDYIDGMNDMALASCRFNIRIYAFELMRTHWHILLLATGEECVKLFRFLKDRRNTHHKRRKLPPLPEKYGFKLLPVESEQQMRNNYLYIFRNAFEVINVLPTAYPWGSAYMAFSQIDGWFKSISASELSERKLQRLLKSETTVPGSYRIHPDLGMIYPSSYIDVSLFYKLFANVKQFETMLVKDYESYLSLADRLEEDICLSVEEARELCQRLIPQMFAGKELRQLTNDEKFKFTAILHSKYHLDEELISRAVFIPIHIVKQVLQSKQYKYV